MLDVAFLVGTIVPIPRQGHHAALIGDNVFVGGELRRCNVTPVLVLGSVAIEDFSECLVATVIL